MIITLPFLDLKGLAIGTVSLVDQVYLRAPSQQQELKNQLVYFHIAPPVTPKATGVTS